MQMLNTFLKQRTLLVIQPEGLLFLTIFVYNEVCLLYQVKNEAWKDKKEGVYSEV